MHTTTTISLTPGGAWAVTEFRQWKKGLPLKNFVQSLIYFLYPAPLVFRSFLRSVETATKTRAVFDHLGYEFFARPSNSANVSIRCRNRSVGDKRRSLQWVV